MKPLKLSKIHCPLCDHKWRLTKVETYNNDKFLLCFHCDPTVRPRVKFGVIYDKHGKIATVEPFDEVIATFKSQEEAINKCIEVMEELD